MSSLNPVERAASLGGAVAVAPLRLVGGLASPARGDMARNVRRAIGINEKPPAIATDPDDAYLAPDGVARLVHNDLPSMLIGGVSALLLQMLHPLAMAGVAEHSGYREDPLGRLRRTAAFVAATWMKVTRSGSSAEYGLPSGAMPLTRRCTRCTCAMAASASDVVPNVVAATKAAVRRRRPSGSSR